MKKALLYNPYLDTLGGGEYFTLAVGKCLLNNNFRVDIAWKSSQSIKQAGERFLLNYLDDFNLKPEADRKSVV